MATIGQNIKKLREDYHWTQEILASKTGINRGLLSSYESDRRKPKIAYLCKLSKLFDVSIADIDESLADVNSGIQTHGDNSPIQGSINAPKAKRVTITDNAQIDLAAVRAAERQRIINEVISLDIDLAAKDAVLKLIKNLK